MSVCIFVCVCACVYVCVYIDTDRRDEALGPLSIIQRVGRDGAHLALRHQLPLSRRGRFHQGTGRRGDGLGRLQDLFLEVQSLVCLLVREGEGGGGDHSKNQKCPRNQT